VYYKKGLFRIRLFYQYDKNTLDNGRIMCYTWAVKRKIAMKISEVARLAGVSISTVSRVINNVRGVKQENRLRVIKIIEQCCYRPDPYAQYLGRRRNGYGKGNMQ
jgi:predicted DNA-binding transcriptional regulator